VTFESAKPPEPASGGAAVAETRRDPLQALAEASAGIAAAETPEATLQEITDQARRLIGTHLAATHRIKRSEWPYALVTTSLSEKYDAFAGFDAAPTGAGLYAEVVRSKRPLRLAPGDLKKHSAWRGFSEYRSEHPPLRGLLAAPLRGRSGDSIGVIMLSDKVQGEFTEQDEAILLQLAQFASVSIEKALAAEALRLSEERLRATHDSANVALGECDAAGRFLHVNSGFCTLTGYSKQELLRLSFFDLTDPEDADRERPIFERHVAGELKSYSFEKRYRRKDGSLIWVLVSASAVYDDEGRFRYGVRVVQDITDRKRADDRQQLLVRELHHRVKNVLAIVQAIASSTIRSVEGMEQFRAAFTARLVSLGKSHSLLTENAWRGASLRELLRLEFDRHDEGARTWLSGPEVHLPPDMAVPLGMAFHELTTNAVKHGALSVLGGRIDVTWTVQQDEGEPNLLIIWRESNGPPVGEPTKRGFGSQLLERVLGSQVRGRVDVNFAVGGVCVTVEATLPAGER
jgi:PAS domain S-box-containing protein